jgi:hypothetical protein
MTSQAQRNDSDHPITPAQRSERIREMAEQAYSSRQIATAVGMSARTVRDTAKRQGIDIHADKTMGRSRHFDFNRIVNQIIYGLEATRTSIGLIQYDQLDREQMPQWITSMRTAEGVLRRHRERLEATLAQSDRRCPVCDTAVTGRTDRVYCGATCRQRARRSQ